MKFRPSRALSAQIALGSALVLAFAGCQVAPVTKAPLDTDRTIGAGGKNTLKPGDSTAPAQPTAEADAQVTGRVLDLNGNPIAGAVVLAAYGFEATTDADGRYSMKVHAEDELRLDITKDGFLPRQLVAGVAADTDVDMGEARLKALDAKVTKVDAKGATVVSSDGKSILEIPEGALEGEVGVRLTWMDPMPSDAFPYAHGELPGALVTRTRPDGSDEGESLVIPPIAFADVQMEGGQLKPGAQATLRMKVNPAALELAGDNIDFNNPVTLQQPCYDFDRETGLWVNPSTSKLEKDENGDVWFVYTLRASEAPKNYKALSHVSGQQRIYWQERERRTRSYQVWVSRVGGGGSWVTRTETYYVTVTRSRLENLYGRHFGGTVKEQSSYSGYNGQGISGATVYHSSDFYGRTTKSTGGNGGFDIPMWHNSSGVGVSSSRWRGASSTGGGYNMTIPTDGTLKYHIMGGSLNLTATRSNVANGARGASASPKSEVAARDSKIAFAAPAAPLYVRNASGGAATLTGDVPVRGTLDLGVLKVAKDMLGKVVERVTSSPDNHPSLLVSQGSPSRSRLATDGAGLGATSITGFTDTFTGATSATTGSDGTFKFAILGNAAGPVVSAAFQGLNASDNEALTTTNSVEGAAQGQPYTMEIRTDATYELTLKGVFTAADAGKQLTLTYEVDGGPFKKTVTLNAEGKINFTFARDTADNKLSFKLIKGENEDMILENLPQPSTLTPGGSDAGEAELKFKAGAVKYRN